ncbi:MAG: SHOCT domain-containing protein, partial [Alphaproteobacteria bacterium]|nr:SHOCT domain-containing protein [Alphaproteobacteria bacterium]
MDLEELEKLHELKEKGILSAEEFEQEKQKILNDTKKETVENNNNSSENNDNQSEVYNDFSHLGVIKGSFEAFISMFKRWNDFKGRTSRFDFWGANLFLILLQILFNIFSTILMI